MHCISLRPTTWAGTVVHLICPMTQQAYLFIAITCTCTCLCDCEKLSVQCAQGLMFAHDGVARSKQPKPQQQQQQQNHRAGAGGGKTSSKQETDRDILYERASQYGEDSIKIVRLQKTAEPLVRTYMYSRGCAVQCTVAV